MGFPFWSCRRDAVGPVGRGFSWSPSKSVSIADRRVFSRREPGYENDETGDDQHDSENGRREVPPDAAPRTASRTPAPASISPDRRLATWPVSVPRTRRSPVLDSPFLSEIVRGA